MAFSCIMVCEQCGKEEDERKGVGWISTSVEGVDVAIHGEKPISGLFCSRKCCSAYFAEEKTPGS